jgi:hypothetical protein
MAQYGEMSGARCWVSEGGGQQTIHSTVEVTFPPGPPLANVRGNRAALVRSPITMGRWLSAHEETFPCH